MKSYGVTIQMKPCVQYFHLVLFMFKYFTKSNLGFVLNFDFEHSWSKRVNTACLVLTLKLCMRKNKQTKQNQTKTNKQNQTHCGPPS